MSGFVGNAGHCTEREERSMSAMEQDLPAAKCIRGVEEEVMGPKKGVPSSQETW
jgi:hypothetical protein